MTPTELDAIRARLATVDPGTLPWTEDAVFSLLDYADAAEGAWDEGSVPKEEAAGFVTHAPADIAALLAEVARLQRSLDLADKACDELEARRALHQGQASQDSVGQ